MRLDATILRNMNGSASRLAGRYDPSLADDEDIRCSGLLVNQPW